MARKRKKPERRASDRERENLLAGGAGDSRKPRLFSVASLQKSASLLAVCAMLLLAVMIVFGQVVRHEFINFDDNEYVQENPPVAGGFSAKSIAWAFTAFHSGNWHPLTWLSHMLDCEVYGLNQPGGHHLMNILLHAASAMLLFLALRRMTGDLWPSALVAALFAVHPLHVESVAWVAERKDVLSGLFFMLILLAYPAYARRPFSLFRYLLVTALLVLGLLAKPMLVTTPFVLLLLDYWPLRRIGGKWFQNDPRLAEHESGRTESAFTKMLPGYLVLEKLPWLMLAAASSVVTYFAQGTAVVAIQRVPLPMRLANAVIAYGDYLWQFFYPLRLAAYYPHWQAHAKYTLPVWHIVGSLTLLAGISVAVMAVRRRCPYLAIGWLWYLGMLVPVIGLLQVGFQAMADRYTYLTQIGLYIALAWGVEHVARSWHISRRLCAAASAVVIAMLMSCAWQQASYWKDSVILWNHALDCTANNCFAHESLAHALYDRGQLNEAIPHYQTALEILPDFTEAHGNLGNALADQGRLDEAVQQYMAVVSLSPGDELGHMKLGNTLARQGKLHEAEGHFREAYRLNPADPEASFSVAKALQQQGQIGEAVDYYQKTLATKPEHAEAHFNLGAILVGRGQPDAALPHFRKAVEIKPDYAEAQANLAMLLAHAGQVPEAMEHYQAALRVAIARNDTVLADAVLARIQQLKPLAPDRAPR